MRVLQVSSALRFGRCEEHICDLSAGLAAKGVEVRGVVRPGCEWNKRLEDSSYGPLFEADLNGPKDLRSAIRVARCARETGADIIHTHIPQDHITASVAARVSGAKLIISHHGRSPISRAAGLLAGNASGIIAGSLGAEMNLAGIFGHERIARIPTGVSMPDGSAGSEFRTDYGIGDDMKIVAAVGEISPANGHDDLVLAAAEVVRRVPDAYFVIVGKVGVGEGAFKRTLRRLVKVSDLEENVLFLDRLEDTSSLLAVSEVFISLSRPEAFGLATFEAMKAGVPMVAYAATGTEDIIEDDTQGSISSPKDPVGLAENICRILLDQRLAGEIAETVRIRAEERFAPDSIVESTLQVYKSALAKR